MRKSDTKHLLVLISTLALLGLLLGFAKLLVSGEFGRIAIRLPNGKQVYVVREDRGLSSQQVYLTQNSDGCVSADPRNDYFINNPSRPELLYSVTGDGIALYDDPFQRYVMEPSVPWTNPKVSIIRSRNPYYGDIRANPEKYGVFLVKVPLNETCWLNLFRRHDRPK